jgi:hypothetical protein
MAATLWYKLRRRIRKEQSNWPQSEMDEFVERGFGNEHAPDTRSQREVYQTPHDGLQAGAYFLMPLRSSIRSTSDCGQR